MMLDKINYFIQHLTVDNIVYFLQHSAVLQDNDVNTRLLRIIILVAPAAGVFALMGILKKVRGNKKWLLQVLIGYVIVTIILPIILFSYSGIYLHIFPWDTFSLLGLFFIIGLPLLIMVYQRYFYKTDEEYQASKPRVDNSQRTIEIFPHGVYGFLMAWIIVTVFSGMVITVATAIHNHSLSFHGMNSYYSLLSVICALFFYGFLLFFRLYPKCPYCEFGLFDFDLRYNPTSDEEKKAYYRKSYKTL